MKINFNAPPPGEPSYRVVRIWRGSARRRTIMRGVSLAVARLHCSDPRTSCAAWMDTFYKEG